MSNYQLTWITENLAIGGAPMSFADLGVIRDQDGLSRAADTLAAWQQTLPPPTDRPSHELHNLVLTGRLITEAALRREESRGAHFRSDFPQASTEWQRHIVFTAQ